MGTSVGPELGISDVGVGTPVGGLLGCSLVGGAVVGGPVVGRPVGGLLGCSDGVGVGGSEGTSVGI